MSQGAVDRGQMSYVVYQFGCADDRGGGWWYNYCYWACLTCSAAHNLWYTLYQGLECQRQGEKSPRPRLPAAVVEHPRGYRLVLEDPRGEDLSSRINQIGIIGLYLSVGLYYK